MVQPASIAGLLQSRTSTFSTLISAAFAAGLLPTLSSESLAATLFAPTNAAFDALPAGSLDALLNDPVALSKVLLYHLVDGVARATDLSNSSRLVTYNEEQRPLMVSIVNGHVVLNNNAATVTEANLVAGNAIVHVIDAVLLPASVQSLPALLQSDGRFSTLLSVLTTANLASALMPNMSSISNPLFTVFAPTDAAFAALPANTMTALLAPENLATLTNTLLYHVVSGSRLESTALSDGQTASTMYEDRALTVAVVPSRSAVFINTEQVAEADLWASNGIVHVLDGVLLPNASNTLVDVLQVEPNLSLLVAALNAADLASTLSGPGPFTVLAPSNSSFASLQSSGTLDLLLQPQNAAELRRVLLSHVVSGRVRSTDLTNGQRVATLSGLQLTLQIDSNGVRFVASTSSSATVTTADVVATNGFAHYIQGVLVPSDLALAYANGLSLVENNAQYSTLASALDTTGLTADLARLTGPYTIFAPVNSAFSSVPLSVLQNNTALRAVLLSHVVAGTIQPSQLINGAQFETLNGNFLLVSVNSAGQIFVGGVRVDPSRLSSTAQGSVYEVDGVLSASSSPSTGGGKKDDNRGAIAGGVIGGLIGLAVIVGLAIILYRRRQETGGPRYRKTNDHEPSSTRFENPMYGGETGKQAPVDSKTSYNSSDV